MANIQTFKKVSKGRTFIRIAATPKGPETRALLRKFHAGVKEFEKKWKAIAAAKKKAGKY
jgi:hypothetical protein